MKKTLIAAIALVAAAGSVLAEPVDADEARTAVENWLKSGRAMGCTGMGDVADVQAYDGREGVGKFYVISLRNGAGEAAGYVVTSADRKLNPVLAYSDDGMFGATDENPLWTMLTIDVSAVTKGLAAEEAAQSASSGKRLLATAPTENERKWAALLGGASAGGSGTRLRGSAYSSISDVRVTPLLTTKWEQDSDKHYNNTWNLMTPSNYVCGCVATAAAQIMKYWAWPGASTNITAKTDYTGKVITGSVTNTWRLSDFTTGANKYRPAFGGTYQWSEMADEYSNSSSEASRLAVAKLVRDLGMSVHMKYESSGSGSMNPVMAVRFTDQFAYANAMCRYPSDNVNWDAERDNTIRANLDAGLPLGVSVPGHAIIADGYGYVSGTLYVHFNMGWGGSKNYWYNPPDLTAAGYTDFNSISCLIFNVYPPTKCAEAGRSVVSGRVFDGSGKPLDGVTVEARKGTTTFATTTSNDKGIYAFLLPKAQYTFRAATDEAYATTNITVKACTSNSIKADETAFYAGGDSTGNICGADIVLDIPVVPVATPAFSPKSGTKFFRDRQLVSITCGTSGAEIRYTLDGTEPTSGSALYKGAIYISSSVTVKARAFKMDFPDSEIATATYVRSAIIGANFVQDAAPAAGTSQTVSLPVVGDYSVSFSYSGTAGHYGESAELRLVREGVTNVVATVAASGAGTFSTNLTWTADAAGDWELYLYGAGNSPTVALSGLSISIPATADNLKRYWVYETPFTFGATGTWAETPATADGLLDEKGDNEFTPTASPAGRTVIYTAQVSLDAGEDLYEDANAKAAVGMRTVNNAPTFALLTKSAGTNAWVDVSANALGAPQANVEYTIVFYLDCTSRTYKASVVVDGKPRTLNAADGRKRFAFAGTATPVAGKVEFSDCKGATKLTGSYSDERIKDGVIIVVH